MTSLDAIPNKSPSVSPIQSSLPRDLDDKLLQALRDFTAAGAGPVASLVQLSSHYAACANRILDVTLPHQASRQNPFRLGEGRAHEPDGYTKDGVLLVVHGVVDGDDHELELASGFYIQPDHSQPCIVTCAHTLDRIRRSPLLQSPTAKSATMFVAETDTYLVASEILTCLPRSDLVVYAVDQRHRPSSHTPLTQAVSLYPAASDTKILARFYPKTPDATHLDETSSWWQSGRIHGYRDWAGAEAEPGTYDTLAHLLFSPPPTPGTSGAPILDAESGAVVGVVTGSRMYNRVEGLRGWATPAEAIFHMFSLPGLSVRKR